MISRSSLVLMRDNMQGFEKGTMSLKEMIDSLKALFWIDGDGDEQWTDIFFKHWGIMEEVYAITASKGLSQIDAEGTEIIKNAELSLRQEVERMLSLGLFA